MKMKNKLIGQIIASLAFVACTSVAQAATDEGDPNYWDLAPSTLNSNTKVGGIAAGDIRWDVQGANICAFLTYDWD